MKRAPADVVEALAGHGATADHPVEATDLDLEPVALVRRLGRETRTAARSADGTANVLGGEVARVSIPFGRTLIDNGRAVPCDEACVMLDGCGRPAWTRGLAVLTAADAGPSRAGKTCTPPRRSCAPADIPTLVAPDELPAALVTVCLYDVHLEDATGRQFDPGDVLRGKSTELAKYVARWRATRLD